MIPESFIEDLKYANGVESIISSYVDLKRHGRHLSGLCPFHSEKTPSFTVYPDSQSYYCFGCGNGGDVITFIRNIEHLEYIEALKLLAEKAGMTLPEDAGNDGAARIKARVLEINRETARFYHSGLNSAEGKAALEYLTERGLTNKTIRSFGLGFSPAGWNSLRDHLRSQGFSYEEMAEAEVVIKGNGGSFYDRFRGRVMFPIIDLRGNVIGFGARSMDGKGPKYINSPDTPVFKKSRNLFALNFAKSSKSDSLILGEGYMDVIAMHQAGFTNAVATLGTSLTEEQARLISQYAKRVVIAYDSDGAGQAAAKRAINLFSQTDVGVGVLEIKDAKDPDEYIKKFGAARFAKLLDAGVSAIDFEISRIKKNHELATSEGMVAFLNDFCKLMSGIENDLERSVYIGNTARELDVDKQGLISTVNAMRKKKIASQQRKATHNLQVYAHDNSGGKAGRRTEQGISAMVAEDKLIAAIMKNPDYYEVIKGMITPEDFIFADSGAIFTAISERLDNNRPLELAFLSGVLTNARMSKLSGIMAKSAELNFSLTQAQDYVRAIKAEREKKTDDELSGLSGEELFEYSLKRRNISR